ncbi:Calx-beta domain-containing protein [Synechococcus sp. WH 8109]|uniref:beta strand repeat-containing protein n=1 Tax=Synechococcus sp. WH 8109 TaxID=166314 RepID=UPI0001B8E058|nr:Calx-beta domain-containing protein [Synechococcus sp. WH 8109]
MALATPQAVQLLNLAYFGRPADPASLSGTTSWVAAGATQSQIVAAFVQTSEYQTVTVTPNTTSGEIVTKNLINALYQRLVGRAAADSEVTGWTNAISSGAVNHDYLGITLVNAILNLPESTDIRQVMMAKVESADLYSDYLATDAGDLSAYSTTAGLASGRAFNDSVSTSTPKTGEEVKAVAELLDTPSTYTLTTAAASAAEGDTVTFTLTLNEAPTEAVIVNYVTGTGTAGTGDYASSSGSVTFAAGQQTQFVTVATTEDTSVESDETFTVTFSGTRLTGSVAATGTITNDDVAVVAPTYTLSTSAASASEGDGVTFTLTLDSAPTADVVVNYVTSNGTAGASDYTSTSSSVTFSAGQKTKFVTIQSTEDTAVELDETFSITFSGSSLAADVTATGTITNDDSAAPTYTLTVADVSAAEGDAATFQLTLDSAPTEAIVVNYATAAGTAGATDFTSASSTVTFAAGQTTQFVTIQTTEDTAVESSETFTVNFTGSSLAAAVSATGTITNDDTAVPTYSLTVADVSAAEGDVATFQLTLDSAPTEAVVVNYTTATGTAATTDFTEVTSSVTFAAGQQTKFVNITTTEDTTFETDETFTVTFSGSTLNASVSATGTITNDDADPATAAQTLTLTTGAETLTGAGGADTFDASLSNSLSAFDSLTGGDGNDTITAAVNSAATVVVDTTSIEQFNLTGGANGATLNMESATGVTGINSTNSLAAVTLNNLQSLPTTVGITSPAANQTTTLDFDGAALTGTTDDLQINLSESNNQTITLTRDAGTTEKIETVSINSASEANVIADLQTTGVGTTALELTGSQNLTITAALDNEITSVSGGTFTGNLTLTAGTPGVAITTGTGADDVTGGTGGDTITTGDGADTISSGGGADSIVSGAGID